jgi:hypothetical protein
MGVLGEAGRAHRTKLLLACYFAPLAALDALATFGARSVLSRPLGNFWAN